jgi:hypothetical protein
VIPQAKIVLKNEATGIEKKASSNASGYYVVSSIPSGFKKSEIRHNKLDPDSTLAVDIASLTR